MTIKDLDKKHAPKILKRVAEGQSVVKACKAEGVNRSFFYEWLELDPVNKDKYKKAKEDRDESRKEIVEDGLFRLIEGAEVTETVEEFKINEEGEEVLVKRTTTKKNHQPNHSAVIFYAKTRIPEYRQEEAVTNITTNYFGDRSPEELQEMIETVKNKGGSVGD